MQSVAALGAIFSHPFGGSDPTRLSAFLVLLAFVVSFLFIRTSTRMIRAQVSWWPGNIETESGLHLHHMVWGIALLVLAGFASFALPSESAWTPIAAVAFGIGCGLTLDEFALWLNLDDVYWAQEGRVSLDAVTLTVAFMALVVIGTKPFGLDDSTSVTVTALAVLQAVVFSGLAFFKGRIGLGTVGIFLPFYGIWATCRLAKPNSPWARRWYDDDKLARAAARFPPDRRSVRWRDRFFDAIGGKPSELLDASDAD